jgi:hypothetical protein
MGLFIENFFHSGEAIVSRGRQEVKKKGFTASPQV